MVVQLLVFYMTASDLGWQITGVQVAMLVLRTKQWRFTYRRSCGVESSR